jgi:hypothetical protein
MPRQKFWQTQKFKELQKKWEEKLTESGFKDIEHSSGNLKLKTSSGYRNHKCMMSQEEIDAKSEYYRVLGQRHHEEIYTDPVAFYVMDRKADGVSVVQIMKELKEQGLKNSWPTVRKILRCYEAKWGISKKKTKR